MQDFCREKTTELRERSIICAVFFLFFFLCFIPLPFPPISGRRSLLLPSVMGILSKMLFNLQKKGVADGLCKPGGSQKRGGEQKKIPNSHLFNGSVSLSCSEKKTFFFFSRTYVGLICMQGERVGRLTNCVSSSETYSQYKAVIFKEVLHLCCIFAFCKFKNLLYNTILTL